MIESSDKQQAEENFRAFFGNRNPPNKQNVSQDYFEATESGLLESGSESESVSVINIEDGGTKHPDKESSQEALKVSQHLTSKLKTLVQMLIAKKKGE